MLENNIESNDMEKDSPPPILFLIFNRLDEARMVFTKIREAKPARLYLASDGPRTEMVGEEETVKSVRNYVVKNIDWPCKVNTLFREKNLGCRLAVSGAIQWFFEHEKMGIILEDDCLPSTSFFSFCDKMLKTYKDDERVMMISGTNFKGIWKNYRSSYFFSSFGGIWGWATWRRAWEHYDVKMGLWSETEIRGLVLKSISGFFARYLRKQVYDLTFRNKIDTWDYQWSFSRLCNSGMSVVPSKNLVKNIGFGEKSTHTVKWPRHFKNTENLELSFPLKNPKVIVPDKDYDKVFFILGLRAKTQIFFRLAYEFIVKLFKK